MWGFRGDERVTSISSDQRKTWGSKLEHLNKKKIDGPAAPCVKSEKKGLGFDLKKNMLQQEINGFE